MMPGKLQLEQAISEQTDIFERVYNPKSPFDFYTDVKDIMKKHGPKEIFIVEPFCHDDILELYLRGFKKEKIKLLTNVAGSHKKSLWENTKSLAKKFKKQNTHFEVRWDPIVHDRVLFLDEHCWVMGQSLKDAANKPAYLIKLRERSQDLKKIYNKIWTDSKKLL